MTPGYRMGYQAPLNPTRIDAYFRGELSSQELVLFAQDAIEVGATRCDPGLYCVARHCVDQGLCTENGRLLQ